MYIQDYSEETYFRINDGYRYISWGWLGDKVNNTEQVNNDVVIAIDALIYAHDKSDNMLGVHSCGICKKYKDRGSFYVDINKMDRYLIPRMVKHYIVDHELAVPLDIQQSIIDNFTALPKPVISYMEDGYYKAFGLMPISVDGDCVSCIKGEGFKDEYLHYLIDMCAKNIKLV
jgi:hypothetical protein